jgi:hypothetical protein
VAPLADEPRWLVGAIHEKKLRLALGSALIGGETGLVNPGSGATVEAMAPVPPPQRLGEEAVMLLGLILVRGLVVGRVTCVIG